MKFNISLEKGGKISKEKMEGKKKKKKFKILIIYFLRDKGLLMNMKVIKNLK
jgi:hypothetical protein